MTEAFSLATQLDRARELLDLIQEQEDDNDDRHPCGVNVFPPDEDAEFDRRREERIWG